MLGIMSEVSQGPLTACLCVANQFQKNHLRKVNVDMFVVFKIYFP